MNDENKLYGLAFDCPFFERKEDCPLNGIDHLSFKEKVDWLLYGLSNEQKREMVEKHISCSKNRV